MERVTFAVRALGAYGIRDLLLTNAAGGVNRGFRPGDFMVLTDHINLIGTNPLRGAPLPGLPRFVDLTCVYDTGLRRLLSQAGRDKGSVKQIFEVFQTVGIKLGQLVSIWRIFGDEVAKEGVPTAAEAPLLGDRAPGYVAAADHEIPALVQRGYQARHVLRFV